MNVSTFFSPKMSIMQSRFLFAQRVPPERLFLLEHVMYKIFLFILHLWFYQIDIFVPDKIYHSLKEYFDILLMDN